MPKPRKTTRKNATSTCERCRFKKIKCSGHLGPKPCNSCKKLNISADKCIFQPPTRRGPKKVVKNEVIKVGKNDSDDPPESFTDNNEFDAYLQFVPDDQNFFSSQATETMPPTQDYMFSTQDNSMHPTQDNIVIDLTTYINLAAVTPYHLLPDDKLQEEYTSMNINCYELGSEGRKALADALTSLNFHYNELGSDRGKALADDLDLYNNNPFFGFGAPSTCDFLDVPFGSTSQVPPRREALEVTNSVTSANELGLPHHYEIIPNSVPYFIASNFNETNEINSINETDEINLTNETDEINLTNETDEINLTNETDEINFTNETNEINLANETNEINLTNETSLGYPFWGDYSMIFE
ncbi:hypothetical protein F8M41_010507 [Gigaspora margarita]|uniref:Zn(2)-C6 fungal-type domain-containing protein n=1 Tax=Gigaspora margarita TaxID=4874 RepID=A0A8H3X2B5_GIGMA|nr:hypothetical protein F8M41_010507 [Gigaspora margarita]